MLIVGLTHFHQYQFAADRYAYSYDGNDAPHRILYRFYVPYREYAPCFSGYCQNLPF